MQALQHDTVQTKFAGLNRKIAALNSEIRRARETEAALRRSNDELQRFAYVASHYMREPLRTICSFAQSLEKRCGPALDFEGHEYIGFLVTAAQRVSCLIDGLLEYSRVMNSPDGALDVIDTVGVLKEVRFRLQAIIEETGARIVWDHLPIVQAHRLGLVQVFQNLVANALKYRSSEGPVVQISATIFPVQGSACRFRELPWRGMAAAFGSHPNWASALHFVSCCQNALRMLARCRRRSPLVGVKEALRR